MSNGANYSDTTKVSIEVSCGWAKSNPDLFTELVMDFSTKYSSLSGEDNWIQTADFSRIGFITFKAERNVVDKRDYQLPAGSFTDSFTVRVKMGSPGMYYTS